MQGGRTVRWDVVLDPGVPAKCRLFRVPGVRLSKLVSRRRVRRDVPVGGLCWLDVRGLQRGSYWPRRPGLGDVPCGVGESTVLVGNARSGRANHLCSGCARLVADGAAS